MMHRSVARALGKIADDMLVADDGPYLALVVGVHTDRPPALWYALLNGESHSATRLRWNEERMTAEEIVANGRRQTPFRFDDVALAGRWLEDYLTGWRGYGSWSRMKPHEYADHRYDERQRAEIDRQLQAGFYELEHPHLCDDCTRRFASPRGLAAHQRHCRKKAEHGPNGHYVSTGGRYAARCLCGEHFYGSHAEANTQLDAHIIACGSTP